MTRHRVKQSLMRRSFLTSMALAIMLACGAGAGAHQYTIGPLTIGHPWTRVTPHGASTGGAYLKITNNGKETARLTGCAAPDVAERCEMHSMSVVDGIMRMRPLPDGIEIKPGETVEFKPGSYHLMLIGLKSPIVRNKVVSGTLNFGTAGEVAVEFAVEAMGAGGQNAQEHMH